MSTAQKKSSQNKQLADLPVLISSGVYFSGLVGKSLITNQLKKAGKRLNHINILNDLKSRKKRTLH